MRQIYRLDSLVATSWPIGFVRLIAQPDFVDILSLQDADGVESALELHALNQSKHVVKFEIALDSLYDTPQEAWQAFKLWLDARIIPTMPSAFEGASDE